MDSKRKISIIIVVILSIVVLLITMLHVILPWQQKQNTTPQTQEITPNQNMTTGSTLPHVTKPPSLMPIGSIPSSWIQEEDPEYAVAYPPDWHSVSFPPLPEEPTQLYIAVVPKTVNDDDIFPRLDILFYSAAQTTVQAQIQKATSLYNTYAKNGTMQQTAMGFQGMNATQVSGIIDGTVYTQGDPQHKDVVKTFVIFQKGQKVYVVDDAYYNDETAETNRHILLQILATMNFPQ